MIVKPENPEELLAKLKEKPLVLYGMGGAGIRIAKWCDEHQIEYSFADQAAEQKRALTDKPVLLPEGLVPEFSDANIVVTSIVYYHEIVERLLQLGIARENILSYKVFLMNGIRWKDLEESTVWGTHRGRMELIAGLLPLGTKSVADYGEGKLSLKQFIDISIVYYPIDYKKRSEETILCDFDKDALPDLQAEAVVCTATLVFIEKAESLLQHFCRNAACTILLSYVTTDIFPDTDGRRASGYVNDYSEKELIAMFQKSGFVLKEKHADPANKLDTIYLFCK